MKPYVAVSRGVTLCSPEDPAFTAGGPYRRAQERVVSTEEPLATVTVLVRTVSELNDHSHWRARQKRAKEQHWVTFAALQQRRIAFGRRFPLPMHVHMTRLAPRNLDTDNLAGALKAVRDAAAKFLGVDDGDEAKVSWSVGQDMAHAAGLPPKTYGVRIQFYRRQA